MEPTLLLAVGAAIIGSGGAAWAGVKVSLNGTRERVTRIELRQDSHGRTLDQVVVSQARMEEQLKAIRGNQ